MEHKQHFRTGSRDRQTRTAGGFHWVSQSAQDFTGPNFITHFYSFRLSRVGFAVTVTRGCVGVWDIMVGKLIARLADSPLGAIVTHAAITQDGK